MKCTGLRFMLSHVPSTLHFPLYLTLTFQTMPLCLWCIYVVFVLCDCVHDHRAHSYAVLVRGKWHQNKHVRYCSLSHMRRHFGPDVVNSMPITTYIRMCRVRVVWLGIVEGILGFLKARQFTSVVSVVERDTNIHGIKLTIFETHEKNSASTWFL